MPNITHHASPICGGVNVDVKTEQHFDLGTQPTNVAVIGYARTLFTIQEGFPPSTVVTTNYLVAGASNIMTVAGQMLDMPDNGLTHGAITVTTRDPTQNTIDCNDGSYAEPPISYASTDFASKTATVCLGRINNLDMPDTWRKFVIAHELGHVAQGFGMGNMTTDDDNVTEQALCRCDHVTASNQIHCLQSQEYIAAGESEGFAHFYASRIFNFQEEPNCAYGYYKQFKDPQSVVHDPPVSIDCKAQVKWLENYCLAADRGVEYDWLDFIYDVNTAPISARTRLADLWQIYLGACTPPDCELDDVKWVSLKDAALAYYSQNDPRYIRFLASGSNFGVSH